MTAFRGDFLCTLALHKNKMGKGKNDRSSWWPTKSSRWHVEGDKLALLCTFSGVSPTKTPIPQGAVGQVGQGKGVATHISYLSLSDQSEDAQRNAASDLFEMRIL